MESTTNVMFPGRSQTVKGVFKTASTADIGSGFNLAGLADQKSFSNLEVGRMETDTMSSPTAAAGSQQSELESLQQQLDNERMKHEKELEKETERRETERQKFELEIEKLDEEVARLKAESVAKQGCSVESRERG